LKHWLKNSSKIPWNTRVFQFVETLTKTLLENPLSQRSIQRQKYWSKAHRNFLIDKGWFSFQLGTSKQQHTCCLSQNSTVNPHSVHDQYRWRGIVKWSGKPNEIVKDRLPNKFIDFQVNGFMFQINKLLK
jgi:hypothetical protein